MMSLMGSLERILLGNPLGGSYAGSVKSMWEQGSINIDTGEETSSETGVRSGYLDARENAYYTQQTIGWGTFDKIIWYFYTSEKEFLGVKTDTTWTALELAPVNCAYIRLVISNDATPISPTDVPDITLEDRDVWGWMESTTLVYSQTIRKTATLFSVSYDGDLKEPVAAIYRTEEGSSYIREYKVPANNINDSEGVFIRLLIRKVNNPTITPADMVNHGTWTVTFSDPVSDHWQDDGTDIWQQIALKTAGKSLAIAAPESFVGCYISYQMSDGQHHATLPYTIPDTTDVEWVQLRIPKTSNPTINLTNVDSYDDQWSWVFGEIVVTEPHWEGDTFVYSASDIQVGKAWQKSGNDIVLVDDASSIALPIIPNVSASWTILIDNSSDSTLTGVEIRKTSSGVTVGDGTIKANNGRSVILRDATGEVAFHFTKGSLTADTLYSAIKIHGR